MTTIHSQLKQHALLWLGLAVLILTILFVNPFRETPFEDDWAFALTVEHLLNTGNYRPHDYAGMNMPFQAYWGGLFAHVLGYSFSSLRISTLLLVFLGLIAFYYLAREHKLDDTQAGLITIGLFASPLVLNHSFTFMTDVPFLMCLIVALFLYTRAIRLHSYSLMVLASIAASAAILTRQFGVALPAGVFFLWAFSRECRQKALFFWAGLIFPVVAGLWQLYTGIVTPNWTARYHMRLQSLYFTDLGTVLGNILWRPTVILQYLALFSLPFVLLALLVLTFEIKQSRVHTISSKLPRLNVLLGVSALYILAGLIYGHFVNHVSWLIPYLAWDDTLARLSRWQRGSLTLITSFGAILYAYILVLRYSNSQGWERMPPSERLLDLVSLFLLMQLLIFRTIGDRYLIAFLPFLLIVVGRHLGSWLNRFSTSTAMACLAMLVTCAIWTRGLLTAAEAEWKAAELIRATGVDPVRIYGSPTWNRYYGGAFDDWRSQIDDRKLTSQEDFWIRYLPERSRSTEFLVTGSADSPVNEKWEVVTEVPYSNTLFRVKHFYVLRRVTGDQ